jgi:Zn-dependent peptidase ImmA (M78 family)
MAHVLLEHQFTVAILGPDGCRSVDPEIEAEAEWFGGELLITYAAAMMLARRNASDAEVARRYGVSQKRAAMRMNASGARTVVTRQRATRRS